jgi:hypothetical protein
MYGDQIRADLSFREAIHLVFVVVVVVTCCGCCVLCCVHKGVYSFNLFHKERENGKGGLEKM